MKFSRICALACAVLITGAAISSCATKWDGYEKTDLSQYIKVGNYKGINITLKSNEVTDADLQSKIDEISMPFRYEEEIADRAAEIGDFAKIDYVSTIDNVADSNFTGSDTSVHIGSGIFLTALDGVEKSLTGHRAGDIYKVDATFPEYYKNNFIDNEDFYNGKSITIEITVKKIYRVVTPELTDELVAKITGTDSTVEQYKAELREQLAAEKADDAEMQKKIDAWSAVMDSSEVIKYPKEEVDAAVKAIDSNYTDIAKQIDSKLTLEEYVSQYLNKTMEDYRAEALSLAQNNVAEQMVMNYIVKNENITVSDEEYENGLVELAAKYDFESPEAFETHYGTSLIRQSMLFEKIMTLILENANIG